MKNKKLTGLLLLVVAVIWGVVIRRVVSYTDSGAPPAEGVRPVTPVETAGRDYTLSLDYRDPFGLTPAPKKEPVPARQAVESPTPEPESPPLPPPILFRGTIRQGGRSYALLDEGLFLPGDTLNGYLIRSVSMDSVILQQGKYRYTIKP